MALITAAAGGGNWTVGSTWVGGIAPTAADDALLTSASGNVTIDNGAVCRSLDCNTYTGVLTHTAAVTLNIGDGTAGAGNRALRLVSGMTYTLGSATTSKIAFISTSATVQTVACGSKTLGSVDFNGVGGSWQLVDTYTTGTNSSNITNVLAGAFDSNGQTMNIGTFRSNNSTTRSITLGASVITVGSSSGCQWDLGTTTGLTFSGASSTISLANGNGTFAGGGLTYGTVSVTSSAGGVALTGSNNFTTLTLGASNSGRVQPTAGTTQTVSGTCTLQGSSSTSMGLIISATPGTPFTISAAVAVIQNINLADFTGAGAATWSGTNIGTLGGLTNVTATTPVDRYWMAVSGGNWNATSSWSATDGGATGASIPLPQDTVYFTANSITSGGRTITCNVECLPSLDFTNILNSPTVTMAITNGQIYLNGSLTLISAMTFTPTISPRFCGRGSTNTLTMAGKTFTASLTLEMPGGTLSLVDNFLSSAAVTLNSGTLTVLANFTALSFSSSNTFTRAINMGAGSWTLTGTGTVWNTNTAGVAMTMDAQTSTVVISDTSSATKSVTQGSQILYAVTVIGGGGGITSFGSNFRVTNFNCNPTASTILQFANAGNAITVTGDWNVNGIAGTLLVITSTVAASQFTFTKASGLVSSRYVSIRDSVATGGAYFQAVNSTDAGNNSGWNFTTASAGGGLQAGKKFARFGGARAINEVMDSKLHGYRKLGG